MARPDDPPPGGRVTNQLSFDFTDTEVLVTGGTSGIGFAVASAFVDDGATVTVTGRRASRTSTRPTWPGSATDRPR